MIVLFYLIRFKNSKMFKVIINVLAKTKWSTMRHTKRIHKMVVPEMAIKNVSSLTNYDFST
jgi:hypothetical protein